MQGPRARLSTPRGDITLDKEILFLFFLFFSDGKFSELDSLSNHILLFFPFPLLLLLPPLFMQTIIIILKS